MLAAESQVMLDVSASCCRVVALLFQLVISGETHLEVAQSTAGHKAFQLLSGRKGERLQKTHSNFSGHYKYDFLQGYLCHLRHVVQESQDEGKNMLWRMADRVCATAPVQGFMGTHVKCKCNAKYSTQLSF